MDLPMTILCWIKVKNDHKEPVWFTRLSQLTQKKPNDVLHALMILEDLGLIESNYEETEKGRVGRCYHLTEFAKMEFKEWENGKEKVILN